MTRCDQKTVKGRRVRGGRDERRKKNPSPALFVIKRLNPISDSLVSAGDRIEHGR